MDQSKKESKSQKGAPPLEKARTTDKKRERERERERERRRRRVVGAFIFCRLSFPVRLEGR